MTKKLKYTQADVSRLIKGAEKAGKEVEKIEVNAEGKLVAFINKDAAIASDNPWDELLR